MAAEENPKVISSTQERRWETVAKKGTKASRAE